ncbi:hypothetical protein NHI66_002890 [Clostridium botulinum]|nr:hypothetical protein [Clostridium botulinum]
MVNLLEWNLVHNRKYKCGFRITNKDFATVFFDKKIDLFKLIDEFRFYSEHIIYFYDENMKLIKYFLLKDIFV